MRKLFLLLSFCFLNQFGFGQANPGYLGKRHALGANIQLTPFFKSNRFLTFDVKAEQTLRRHLSLEASIGFFSHTFSPNDYLGSEKREKSLYFKNPGIGTYYGEYKVNDIIGDAKFRGLNLRLGLVRYSPKHGSMAPYGKRSSFGLYLTDSKIIEDKLIYNLRDEISSNNESVQYTINNGPGYPSKKIGGFYVEIGEKRILKDQFYLQYLFQLNVPLSFTYSKNTNDPYYANYQDYLENIMKNSILLNNLLCFHLGGGIILK
jgi:hypothetical protein